MQITVLLKNYILTYEHMENVAIEYFGKVLTVDIDSSQEYDVEFLGDPTSPSESDALIHSEAFTKGLNSFKKPKSKKDKE